MRWSDFMNTQIVLTLGDVGKVVLWAALVAILLYLIFILRRIYIAVKDLTSVVEENRESIDEIIAAAPGITKNFERISGDLANDVAAFNNTVSNVAGITERVTSIKNLKETLSKKKKQNDNDIVLDDE
jgi:uncharacterized protein YoxC